MPDSIMLESTAYSSASADAGFSRGQLSHVMERRAAAEAQLQAVRDQLETAEVRVAQLEEDVQRRATLQLELEKQLRVTADMLHEAQARPLDECECRPAPVAW